MNFQVFDFAQRSPEWYAIRCGKLTGSCAADMLATIKSGEAAARRDLRTRLVIERLTGEPQEDGFISADMRRGMELEADAFKAYEAFTGEMVRRTGFVAHASLPTGCSPDGVIGNFRALIELKVPKSATHLKYLRSRAVPSDYLAQVRHALWLTDAECCDFVSFDPRFPPSLRLMITRVTMTEAERTAYELLVRMFLAEVDREFAEVEAMAVEGAAA